MRRYVLPFLFIGCVVLGALYFVLGTPFAINAIMPRLMQQFFPELKVEKFWAKSQSFRIPEHITLNDITVKMSLDGRQINGSIQKAVLHDFVHVFQERKIAEITFQGVQLKSKDIEFSEMNAKTLWKFYKGKVSAGKGVIDAKSISLGKLFADKASATYKASNKEFSLDEFSMDMYGGALRGQWKWEFIPEPSMIFWGEFENVSSGDIVSALYPLQDVVDMRMDGSLRFLTSFRYLDMINLEMFSRGGAVLKKDIVEELLSAISDENKRSLLEGFVNTDGSLPLSMVDARLQNGRGDEGVFIVNLKGQDNQFLFSHRFRVDLDKTAGPLLEFFNNL